MKALVALAFAASAAAAGLSFAATPKGADVLVTRDSLVLPAGCSPRQVAAVVNRFFDAFNRGDMEALDQIFVKEDSPGRPIEPHATRNREFRWYSVTEGGSARTRPWRHRSVYDRPELLAYFAERHRADERMRLLGLRVAATWRPGVGIGFVVRREADDLPLGLGGRKRIALGKGHVECDRQQISLWTMGMEAAPEKDLPSRTSWPCPLPKRWTVAGPPLTCAATGRAPTAQEISPSYRSEPTAVELAGACAPAAVEARLLQTLRAFNVGIGRAFARSFGRPLHGPPGLHFRGRRLATLPQLAAYASNRYQAGEGWTLLALTPPRFVDGAYRLRLRVGGRTHPPLDTVGKLVVDCRTGLIGRLVLASG